MDSLSDRSYQPLLQFMAVSARMFVTGHVLDRCLTIHGSLSRSAASGSSGCGRCDLFTQIVLLLLEGSASCAVGFRLSFAPQFQLLPLVFMCFFLSLFSGTGHVGSVSVGVGLIRYAGSKEVSFQARSSKAYLELLDFGLSCRGLALIVVPFCLGGWALKLHIWGLASGTRHPAQQRR